MKITPQSTITLYSGVDIGTEQQLAFSSRAKQTAYFASKVKKSYVNCTVVKNKIGVIKVAIKPYGQAGQGEITGTDLASCNYMSFTNKTFDKIDANTDRVIYAYIVDYSYENNETALIQYVIDYWQTWCFDVTYHDMYIDREHLSQDEWAKVEANPYRADVPQMVTAEPLPTPMEYEKPFYDVKWYGQDVSGTTESSDDLDGKAFLSTLYPTGDTTGGPWVEKMLLGDWEYWNVLLIQAPTNWNYFAESDDEGTSRVYPTGSIVRHGNPWAFYQVTASGSTDTEPGGDGWTQLTVMNAQGDTSSDELLVLSQTYVCDNYGGLFFNGTMAPKTFHPKDSLHIQVDDIEFTQKLYTVWGGDIQAEYEDIIRNYGIIVTEAGSLTTKIPGPMLDQEVYSWSVKPKGCDILYIRSSEGWKALANFYSKYHGVSQIIGIFGVPANMFELGHIGTDIRTIYNQDRFFTNVSSARTALATDGKQKSVRNKKLYTSPFSYYRVIAPNGQVKEYSYEKFSNIADTSGQTPDTTITFRIIADVTDENPKLYFVPCKYKVKNTLRFATFQKLNADYPAETGGLQSLAYGFDECLDYNMDEAICVGGFPEISFNTDGYLTFLGNQYAQYMSERTSAELNNLQAEKWNMNEVRNAANFGINAAGNLVNNTMTGLDTGGEGGALGGAIATLGQENIKMVDSAVTYNMNKAIFEDRLKKYTTELGAWRNGDLLSSDNPYVQRFNTAKGAYANSVYTGGTGGVIRYIRGMGIFDFIGIHVQLRPEIIDYYDKWFDLYGYASGRCGIPHVIDFVKGETGATKVPHWATVNGANTTYVKTHDAKVEHAMLPVARAISDMFNSGIRFQKGDLS